MKRILILFIALLFFPSFILAEDCPDRTTVEETDVNFVGELTDMGGDNNTYVWFEYGQTTNYGQATREERLTDTGFYCIKEHNLEPSTTYYYRAVAENEKGTSYGQREKFTTEEEDRDLDFTVEKLVRNLSDGTDFAGTVDANPGDVLVFRITIEAGSYDLDEVLVRDTLPGRLIYQENLKLDNSSISGNITEEINIGDLSLGEEKNITYRARIEGPERFSYGQTKLTNSVLVSTDQNSLSDEAEVRVLKGEVAGAATAVSTALTNNILLDSFFIPLVVAALLFWLFKSHLISLEEWLDSKKKKTRDYKAKKQLYSKIHRIKTKDFFE